VGSHTFAAGETVTNRVNSPDTQGATQYVATGWAMTGNAPFSGDGSNFVMTVTNDAVLTWLWATNFWLDTGAGPHGSVDVGDDWQPSGATVEIEALEDPYYHFTNWTGDVVGPDVYTDPLNLVMDGPKSVSAHFAENLTTNTGTPEWWLAQHGLTNNFNAEAVSDQDGDRAPAWEEYIAGTDPTNAASVFRFQSIRNDETERAWKVLKWSSASGRAYSVQAALTLKSNIWQVLTNDLPATPPQNVWTDAVDRGAAHSYRLHAEKL
jgi:hypothetical protein